MVFLNENKIEVFSSAEFGTVRTLNTEDGKVLFCGADVAKALGYSNPYDALTRHCKLDGVVKHEGVSKTTNQYGKTTEQIVEMKFITEGNVYR
ncbi:MAG: Bro-N domain-containing protein, partial [Ruminococcus sp.]|nr:Bro-N domain-containing protein [Ruminococcus sp.]